MCGRRGLSQLSERYLKSSAYPYADPHLRWSMYLRDYDFVVRHHKGALNPADALSGLPVNFIGENEDGVEINIEEGRESKVGESEVGESDSDEEESGDDGGNGGEDISTGINRETQDDSEQRPRVRQAMDHAKWSTIYTYLTELRYPNGCNEKFRRKIRRWSAKYRVEDGKLFLLKTHGEYPIEVLHTGNVVDTVRRIHQEGHFGINNTWRRAKERFTGPQLFEVVERIVKCCDRCQERRNREKTEEMRPIEAGRVFDIVGIDAIGPLPVTRRENRYILVTIDYVSRYPMARAVPSIRTEDTIDFIFQEGKERISLETQPAQHFRLLSTAQNGTWVFNDQREIHLIDDGDTGDYEEALRKWFEELFSEEEAATGTLALYEGGSVTTRIG
ncbi:uncharacterized protein VTP21DRAFT_4601 [Calcarisporiella thermophila]|uniref:uncharacterized protein n=1 Tax=Calcarisporiella thermophila TaxID=911321 RepID=UPI003743F60D